MGGGTAIQFDYADASRRDIKIVVPLALVLIAVILAILLQALVAPLVLIASVVISFFGTFGLSILFFRFVVGDEGIDSVAADLRVHLPGRARASTTRSS